MKLDAVLILGLKGLIGGTMVVVFALAGEVIRPRSVAGVTSAAPSVAVASLAVTVIATGASSAAHQALGMIAGGAALVVCCLCGLDTVKRFGALKGSAVAAGVWLAVAVTLWEVSLR